MSLRDVIAKSILGEHTSAATSGAEIKPHHFSEQDLGCRKQEQGAGNPCLHKLWSSARKQRRISRAKESEAEVGTREAPESKGRGQAVLPRAERRLRPTAHSSSSAFPCRAPGPEPQSRQRHRISSSSARSSRVRTPRLVWKHTLHCWRKLPVDDKSRSENEV